MSIIGPIAIAVASILGGDLADHRWPLDEGRGDVLRDAAGGPPGKAVGAAWDDGLEGKCLRLDGRGYAALGDVDVGGSDFTAALWICPTGPASRPRILLGKDRSGVGAHQLRLYLTPGNGLGFAMSGEGGGIWPFETGPAAVPSNRWSHVALTRKGNEYALLVNGKTVATKTAPAPIVHANDLELRLGARHGPGGDGPDSAFAGLVADLRIVPRALPAAEVAPPERLLALAREKVVPTPRKRPEDLVRPTPEQLAWQDLEIGMFYHFDIPIFTDLGEGDWQKAGRLDPSIFDPAKLDTEQWMEAAEALGARYTVFVAKHCSGFLPWQSDLYPYGVKQSRWRGGKGDVVRDYVASCRKHGIEPGLYASVSANAWWEVTNPGIVNWARGGDPDKQARYVKTCEGMLAELWGNYGKISEVWFDGGALPPAQGGPDLVPILKRLQARAMVFGGPAGTIRWIGNESGVAGYPCWATASAKDEWGDGSPEGGLWLPGECDVPLRDHDWFWHPGGEARLYSLERLLDMYHRSVGRNCNLLINAVIDRDGRVPEADVRRFRELGDAIRRLYGKPLAETKGRGETVELRLDRPARIDRAVIMEEIAEGERVREYVLEGLAGDAWKELARGISIGHKRIERFPAAEVGAVRLRVTDSVGEPLIRKLAVYAAE